EAAWIAINDPTRVDAEAQRLAVEFNREREQLFRQRHERMRADLQPAFDGGLARPRSVGALIRHYSQNEDFLYDIVNPIYEQAVGRTLPRAEIRRLLESLPHWYMFLVGYAYAIFQRAIRDRGARNRRNPGNLDLWSATYLPSCDCFVTNDRRQLKAL